MKASKVLGGRSGERALPVISTSSLSPIDSTIKGVVAGEASRVIYGVGMALGTLAMAAQACADPTFGTPPDSKTITPSTATPQPTEAPKPEDYEKKGKAFMTGAMNEYFADLSEADQRVNKNSLDGATMSTFMVTKDRLSYTPEKNYVGEHTLTMSVINSKTGQLSFLFYDLTGVQDRAKLVDMKITPEGHIVGIDRKTGKLLLTIDNAYQADSNNSLTLNPSAKIQMKWNGDITYQDLKVEVDANGIPLQGELVSGQIAFKSQQSGDQIALENETSGGAGRGLLSVVNRNKANLQLLDPKKDGIYVPSLKDKGLNPFIPAVEKSPALSDAIEAYVKAMNTGKGVNEPTL